MAKALRAFSKLQLGIETPTPGTIVAASRVIMGQHDFIETEDFYRPDYPEASRANVGGSGSLVGKGMDVNIGSDLSAEEMLWALLTGVRGAVTPVNHGGGSALTGTSDIAVTTSATGFADSRVAWTVDEFIGATVTIDGKTGVVASNTTTAVTLTGAGWTGGTPTTGSSWAIVTLDYAWTFTPQLTTGIPTIDTATMEMLHSDGVTNHFLAQSAYGMTSSFKIDWALKAVAKYSAKMFGRARQSGGPTGGLVIYPTRKLLVSPLLNVYMDGTWAGLGGTQLNSLVRSVGFECMTGFEPDPDIGAGRADLDYGTHKVGGLTARLSAVLGLDAVGAARLAEYRANSIVFVRLKNTGPLIGGIARKVQIDGAYRFTTAPKFNYDGRQILAAFELESVKDDTSGKTLEFVAQNGLSAIA